MRYLCLPLLMLSLSSVSLASDWLTLPSTYSHDAVSGARVSQYAPIDPPSAPTAPNFRTSGFTHTRSALKYGGSLDNYHRVERWGDPVRPYGEWQRPFRPYSTPYPNWGAPFAGANFGIGGFRGRGFGDGFGGPRFGQPSRNTGFHRPYPGAPGAIHPGHGAMKPVAPVKNKTDQN